MDKTKECLKASILGERGAVKKYTAFGIAATNDSKPNLARLFKALVQAEEVHIKNHLSALGEEFIDEDSEELNIGTCLENVTEAIAGEVEEAKEMYPKFMKIVKKEGKEQFHKVAALSLDWAAKAEKIHAKLLQLAQKSLIAGNDFPYADVYLCRVCGNLEVGNMPESFCAVCGHDEAFFQAI